MNTLAWYGSKIRILRGLVWIQFWLFSWFKLTQYNNNYDKIQWFEQG